MTFFVASAVSTAAVAGCSMPKDRGRVEGTLFRWSVTSDPTGDAVTTGCSDFYSRYKGLIMFRGAAGQKFAEAQTWEHVAKESETPFTEQELTDPAWWCAEQDGVSTSRTPLTLVDELCVTTQDADPPATLDAVTLIEPVTPVAGHGRRIALTVRHLGPLVLNYVQSCAMDPTDAFAPPPWTELTILP